MITDALLQVSTAQAVTTTAFSTDTIDLGVNRDIGAGSDLKFVFGVNTSVTASGAATVTFQIVSSANANLSSPTILAQTDAIGKAELTAGRRPITLDIANSILAAQPIGQRYLGVQYTVGTGPLTAGAFTANLILGSESADHNKYYPSGFTVV
jgi:hypothetical protein